MRSRAIRDARGAGVKAGGPGYLRQFAYQHCVTENTVRRDFAPDLELSA